ncbi:hypothetical protein TBLA_0C02700 [Henningerozyma blattae CBS 6284]|uniref:Amino-acid acetyltransferase, mitochondrial n=1 Tax=Henningerozyma blattae (strain ATCC 34711 / CBS 6284 / DSM 70876 / NBRC 10599 / NRRL Y-10934 / UCD 77-7) TaxID=1071380 RepID=I2H126_HENB6|nr:hypothetical protein TBLA_0C02700 [Tetrapisispora blattae CBS 6284]CCH60078.1 hypothetical protein TBLA_0C02700 [Tetrapisispora blattae CBS 6284]
MWKPPIWKTLTHEQPNASYKRLILSVLNTTATKREAKDYLTKYKNVGSVTNFCLLFIRSLSNLKIKQLNSLALIINKLNMLGLKPICIIPPSNNINHHSEILDALVTRAELEPLHLNEAIKFKIDGSSNSILSERRELFDSAFSNFVPIIKPFAYNEITSTRYMIGDLYKLFDDVCKGDSMPTIDKFFILNKIGGIPSDERKANSHVFINLSQEFQALNASLIAQNNYLKIENLTNYKDLNEKAFHIQKIVQNVISENNENIENLTLMNIVLSHLLPNSTGLITTVEAASTQYDKTNPLVYNLITDRSLISSSLPRFKSVPNKSKVPSLLSILNEEIETEFWKESNEEYENSDNIIDVNNINFNKRININTTHMKSVDSISVTTVFKRGIDINSFCYRTLHSNNTIGLPSSFINENETDANIDVEDRAIENRSTDSDKLNLTKLKYLLDNSFNHSLDLEHYLNRINGNIASIIVIGDYEGVAILTYEGPTDNKFVYLDKFAILPQLKGSLGISDIIFNLIFKHFPDEIVWRSRKDNVVNKWYFQRCTGVLDLSAILDEGDQKESNFKLFYHIDNSNSNLQDTKRIKEYAKYVRDIEPSWVPGT